MTTAGAETTQNSGGPIMKRTEFSWQVEDQYNELKNFRIEENNIFKSYSMAQAEQTAI